MFIGLIALAFFIIVETIFIVQCYKEHKTLAKEEGYSKSQLKKEIFEAVIFSLPIAVLIFVFFGLAVLITNVALSRPASASELQDAVKIEAEPVAVDNKSITFIIDNEAVTTTDISYNDEGEISVWKGKQYLFGSVYKEDTFYFADIYSDDYKDLVRRNDDTGKVEANADTVANYCSECGYEYSGSEKYCPECGKKR